MQSFLFFLAFLVGLLANFKVEAQFFNGATSASCVSLSEPGFTAQTGPSPYFVTFSPGAYRSGEVIGVTLQSFQAQVSSFNAIICQARPLSGGNSLVGSFDIQNSPDYQYVVCPDASTQQISVNGSSTFESLHFAASLCPSNTNVTASPGLTFYDVTDVPLSLPGNISITSGPIPLFITVGMTETVSYTFSNGQSCSFDVTVLSAGQSEKGPCMSDLGVVWLTAPCTVRHTMKKSNGCTTVMVCLSSPLARQGR
ncbi:hypothetical protein HOLleu_21112 [Holothuria leucospilota]|uniref:Reelin domain-containing protein n=1 Tax=Holothuria leucospilota TaxID=206669 RepID=A0A9Q1BX31_HOLLE|nr:hypothetical protein HOLleu_21112 [Holothuria leucospilota]